MIHVLNLLIYFVIVYSPLISQFKYLFYMNYLKTIVLVGGMSSLKYHANCILYLVQILHSNEKDVVLIHTVLY